MDARGQAQRIGELSTAFVVPEAERDFAPGRYPCHLWIVCCPTAPRSLWDLLNQSTARPLTVDEAQLAVDEITGLRRVASRAMDRLGSEAWVHEERGFALTRSGEENERLRTWVRFATELLDTGHFGNADANATAAKALTDALNPDRPGPRWQRPARDQVVVIDERGE